MAYADLSQDTIKILRYFVTKWLDATGDDFVINSNKVAWYVFDQISSIKKKDNKDENFKKPFNYIVYRNAGFIVNSLFQTGNSGYKNCNC